MTPLGGGELLFTYHPASLGSRIRSVFHASLGPCLFFCCRYGYSTEIVPIGFPTAESTPSDKIIAPEAAYATHGCVFRVLPTPPPEAVRSPRSYRATVLPFLRSSSNRFGVHKHLKRTMFHPRSSVAEARKIPVGPRAEAVRHVTRDLLKRWNRAEAFMSDLWSSDELADACGGSQRFLVQVRILSLNTSPVVDVSAVSSIYGDRSRRGDG